MYNFNYIKAYHNSGFDGLTMNKASGRPKRLTDEQEEKLKELILSKSPVDVGFPAEFNWTASLISKWVEREYSIKYTIRGITKILKRLNLSYTRPTYTLAKADPKKQEEFKKEFQYLKKLLNNEINHILFQDESMIKDYQALKNAWFEKGKQKIIPTHGKHQGIKLIGSLNYEIGEVFCIEKKSYNVQDFLEFLEKILKKYPTGKIVMILDNARIHHAKLLKDFLDKNSNRLELFFLPPYSPNLNLIEGLWKWLKE